MLTKKEKLIKKGVKKIFSLTRTKIRLAEEAETLKTIPQPLPLVKLLSGKEIKTVGGAKEYREILLTQVNFDDKVNLAKTVLQLIDIIEGVKHKFEPPECCFSLSEKTMKELEGKEINFLFMTKKVYQGENLFIGENPPPGALPVSLVPSSVAPFLNFAFHSLYFFQEGKLRHLNSVQGHKTLIINAIHFSLGEFGANLKEE